VMGAMSIAVDAGTKGIRLQDRGPSERQLI
jgi:hypothetical protein